ncbi:MAG: hypothetical protein ACI35P_13650 [Bacillus sp. (in: firmicutes)]
MRDNNPKNVLILNCSSDLAKSLIFFREQLVIRSPIDIPEKWPSYRFRSFLPFFLENIEKKYASSFQLWILVELDQKRMIGDILLYDKKNHPNVVNVELYFISPTLERKYYQECVELISEKIFAQFQRTISYMHLEVLYSDKAKIEALKTLGFHLKSCEHPYLIWSHAIHRKENS